METNHKWLVIALVVVSILFWRDHHNLGNQLEATQDELAAYEDALDQANSNIEEAQWYAWSSYDDMGYALDNLETVYSSHW